MARRRRYRRRYRKRRRLTTYRPWMRRRGYRRSRRNKAGSFRGPSRYVIPSKAYTKLTWTHEFNASPPANNTIAWYPIRGNGCYDPWPGIGTDQPTGFDEMCKLYERYFVLGSSITYTVMGITADMQGRMYLIADTDLPGSYSTLVAQPLRNRNVKKAFWFEVKSKPKTTLKGYQSTRGMYGTNIKNDPEFWGTKVQDPAFEWYWNFGFSQENLISDSEIRIFITVTYYVKFMDRVDMLVNS